MNKFQAAYIYTEYDLDFEYLVCLSGALVPIAHIKLIGEVQAGLCHLVDESNNETPLWSFPVMLTDSDYETLGREKVNPQILFDSWDTEEEAAEERKNLASQVDNYYKRLLGDK